MKIAVGKRGLEERLVEFAKPWLSRSTLTRRVKVHSSFADGRRLLIELEADEARDLGEALLRMASDSEAAGGGGVPASSIHTALGRQKIGARLVVVDEASLCPS